MKMSKWIAGMLVVALPLLAAPAGVVAQEQTATDFYMGYRTAFEKAKTVEEILPQMSKAVRAKVEATPKEERAEMFAFLKEMSKMSGLKVVKETKTPEGVMLTVEATQDGEARLGQVQIVKEDGAWKLGRESWKSKS